MATTAVSLATIDLKTQATFPIRLGSSISNPTEESQYTSVHFNHKPQLRSSETTAAQIREDSELGKSRLLIDAQDGEYSYAGTYEKKESSFVLVVRGKGKDRELILERVGSGHAFNLESTPSENDSAKLASQYPQIPDDVSETDLFGDDDEDAPPDDANPFDYRHFLKNELDKNESTSANQDAARSIAAAPAVQPRQVTSAPATKVPKRAEPKAQPLRKRKPPATEKPNNKRVKAGPESPPAAEAHKPKAKPDVPKISFDRRASLRRPSLDDSGALILENPTPVTEKPTKPNAMALALNGQLASAPLRSGPISLQSAANSPGSHMASPAPSRPEDGGEEYVFEFDDDPEPEGQDYGEIDADAAEEEADADADADVDDLELPSPAQAQAQQQQRPSLTAQSSTGAGEDEDDLDEQLYRAMMEEDQESEESEEE